MTTPSLLDDVLACRHCVDWLPDEPRPILQLGLHAPILIAGQAPGRVTRVRGKPFDDVSGTRLRSWLGVSAEQFYNPRYFSILPMGFCFPGSGAHGDLPPRPECAHVWRARLLSAHLGLQLQLLIGQYAQAWHLGQAGRVTERVQNWRQFWPEHMPLPHPSPRNQRWLTRNDWFERDVLPMLQARVQQLILEVDSRVY